MCNPSGVGRLTRWTLAWSLVLFASPAFAQSAGDQHAAGAQSSSPSGRPDFLFGRPRGSVGIRGSFTFARAGSDLFDFVTRQLTIDKSDFNAPGVGGDVAVALTARLDAQAGFEWSTLTRASEYRDLVDNNLRPIEQSTALRTVHVTGSVRYALAARGQDVSRFAWVPGRVVPYVGAGAGAVHYDFQQRGDFVDFQDLSVFPDVFRSNGWAPSGHVFGGLDLRIHRGLYGTFEGRYTRASATLSRDFVDFDPIDLSGFRVSAGVNLLF